MSDDGYREVDGTVWGPILDGSSEQRAAEREKLCRRLKKYRYTRRYESVEEMHERAGSGDDYGMDEP